MAEEGAERGVFTMTQQTLKLVTVPIDICDYPMQPRTWTEAVRDYSRRLGENILAHGQKVPVIGWFVGQRFQLADGGCRLEGAKLVGIRELLALDLGKEPTRAELLLAQASIDLHKQHLPPVDRARLYQSIMTERGFNGKQTAEALNVTESWLSRFLVLTDLAPDLQELVNNGTLEWSKGSLIAQATKDFEQQREMAKAAAGMTRDALAASIRQARNGHGGKGDHETIKVTRIKCDVPGRKANLTVTGKDISLVQAIEIVQDWLREAKKAAEQGLSAKSFERVCKDKARTGV
jgi:ParB family transcriptional regulator, chromosome partitioning protein